MTAKIDFNKIVSVGLLDLSRNAEANEFVKTSTYAPRVVQKPELIREAELCTIENIETHIAAAIKYVKKIKLLKREVLKLETDYAENDYAEYEDPTKELAEYLMDIQIQIRDKYREIQQAISDNKTDKMLASIDSMLSICQQLTAKQRKRLETAKGEILGTLKVKRQIMSPKPQFKRKIPTPTPQSPQFEMPEWLRYIFPLITGSEQRA